MACGTITYVILVNMLSISSDFCRFSRCLNLLHPSKRNLCQFSIIRVSRSAWTLLLPLVMSVTGFSVGCEGAAGAADV